MQQQIKIMSKIAINIGNIVNSTTECVVNAANEYLAYGSGVCGAIFKAAGKNELAKACNEIGRCGTGEAVITPGFLLKSKYIIHAVGPRYFDITGKNIIDHDKKLLRQQLYNAYWNSLDLMLSYDCHSITFPLISSGTYGYPLDEAWETAIDACLDFLSENNNENISIDFAVLDETTWQLGNNLLNHKLEAIHDLKTKYCKK